MPAAHDQVLAAAILRYLRLHARGRAQAVSAKRLALAVGVNERAVREIIHDLREAGRLIASTVEQPAGYYFPGTKAEADICSRHLWARVREIARVARQFDAAAAPLGLHRQRHEQIGFVFDDARPGGVDGVDHSPAADGR